MKKQKRLLFARNVFLFFIFIIFGVIVVTEKSSGLLIPKVEEKLTSYLHKNYESIENSLNTSKVTYKNTVYSMKVSSKDNKNHYFYITYSEKKIKDTYKKDYLEGNNLLNSIKKELQTSINKKTKDNIKIIIPYKLNEYTDKVQERLINEDNLLELRFYIIEKEIMVKEWNSKEITNSIIKVLSKYKDNRINPKSYTIIITNREDITESIEISNITNKFLENKNKETIINDIIKNNNSKLLKENKIKYKYLN